MKPKQVASAGLIAAATLILSYVESLIPFNFGVPGIKLGLANVGVMTALCLLGPWYAAAVSLLRVLINGMLFTGVSAMLYSLCGAALALCAMLPLSRWKGLSLTGVSVAGAAAHIAGQLICASLVLKSGAVWAMSPPMFLAACATGVLNGIITGLVQRGVRAGRNSS